MKPLLFSFLLDLTPLTILRIAFFFRYKDPATSYPLWTLLSSFFMGVRFDGKVVAIVYLPLLLFRTTLSVIFSLFVKRGSPPSLWKGEWIYSSMGGFLIHFIAFFDFGYYAYFHDHINTLIFGIAEDDTRAAVLSTFAIEPVFLELGTLLFLTAFLSFLKRKIYQKTEPSRVLPSLFLLAGFSLLARGSFATYPLGKHHLSFPSPFLNDLSYNGPMALYDALRSRSTAQTFSLSEIEEYLEIQGDLLNLPYFSKDPLTYPLRKKTEKKPFPPPHCVFLLLESFSLHLTLLNSPDFPILGELKTHMEEDLFFSRIVPIGNGTAVTLIPLLVNLPHAEGGIVYSQATPYTIPFPTGIGIPFKEKGYRTIFLYGGNTGWRNLYRFVGMQGFDEVKGGEEIIKELSLPGTMPAGNFWGIYDEYLFRYLWNLLTTAKTPLFVFLLTTTNHPPYTLPPWATPPSLFPPSPWKERIVDKKEIAEKRLKSFWYQGDSFGKFLTLLKSSPLREKVVVAATGDHSIFSLFSFSEEEILLKYGTPFYLYIPRKLTTKKLDPTIPGGHINLLPTLYELTLSEGEYLSFGEPLFPEKDPVGIGEGPLITGKEGVIFRVGKKKEFFRWKDRSSYLLTPHPWDSSAEKLWRKFQSIYLASYLFRESVRSEKGQPFATTTIKRR